MNRWILGLTMFVVAAAGFCPSTRADEVSVSVSKDTKFLVRLDIQAFRATAIGNKLFDIAKSKAQEEFGGAKGQGPDLKKIHEMIGFDPLAEIGAIVVSGSSYDHPEKSLVISIGLKKTTGNLEGMLLALPGYEAKEYGRHTIHSATPDKDQHVFGSIHTDAQGDKTVLLATERDTVIHQLDFLDGKPAAGAAFKTVKLAAEGKPILSLEVFDIPAELIGDGPQSGVAKTVRGVSLRLAESNGNLDAVMLLLAATEQQAEQLRQMAQGLIALVGFANSTDPDDKDLKQIVKYLENIKAARDGSALKVTISLPIDEVSKLIDSID